MRQSPCLVAALLTFLMLAPGTALAFDMQTLGGTNPDGSVNYSDPDEKLEKAPLGISGLTVTPGLQFDKSSGTSVPSFNRPSSEEWQNLMPGGRLTR